MCAYETVLFFMPSTAHELRIRLWSSAVSSSDLISEPFRTLFGWHLAQLLDRRERDVTDEQKRARARTAIGTRKSAEEYDIWLRRLRNEAYIEYSIPSDAEAAKLLQ